MNRAALVPFASLALFTLVGCQPPDVCVDYIAGLRLVYENALASVPNRTSKLEAVSDACSKCPDDIAGGAVSKWDSFQRGIEIGCAVFEDSDWDGCDDGGEIMWDDGVDPNNGFAFEVRGQEEGNRMVCDESYPEIDNDGIWVRK